MHGGDRLAHLEPFVLPHIGKVRRYQTHPRRPELARRFRREDKRQHLSIGSIQRADHDDRSVPWIISEPQIDLLIREAAYFELAELAIYCGCKFDCDQLALGKRKNERPSHDSSIPKTSSFTEALSNA